LSVFLYNHPREIEENKKNNKKRKIKLF